jgi:hypothetical protein
MTQLKPQTLRVGNVVGGFVEMTFSKDIVRSWNGHAQIVTGFAEVD